MGDSSVGSHEVVSGSNDEVTRFMVSDDATVVGGFYGCDPSLRGAVHDWIF